MITKAALNAALQNPIQGNNFSPEFERFLQELVVEKRLNVGVGQSKTISSGSIDIGTTGSNFIVDTESAAASDNLDTVSGGNEGDVVFLSAANDARTVVIRDGQGNIITEGSANLSLDDTDDLAILFYNGTVWKASLWNV